MKSRNSDYQWIPFWVDKWIFGSTRIECSLEERSIWIDFLALASKDNGYIRANETTPYPLEQLGGLLIIPVDTLTKAIQKFIDTHKIENNDGILRIINWSTYQLSESYPRVIKHRLNKGLHPTKRCVTENVTNETECVNNNIIDKNILEENIYLKKKHKEYLLLNDEEYRKLQEFFGHSLDEWLSRLNDYIGSTGRRYKSHYHTLLTWARKDGYRPSEKPKPIEKEQPPPEAERISPEQVKELIKGIGKQI